MVNSTAKAKVMTTTVMPVRCKQEYKKYSEAYTYV